MGVVSVADDCFVSGAVCLNDSECFGICCDLEFLSWLVSSLSMASPLQARARPVCTF